MLLPVQQSSKPPTQPCLCNSDMMQVVVSFFCFKSTKSTTFLKPGMFICHVERRNVPLVKVVEIHTDLDAEFSICDASFSFRSYKMISRAY